MRVSLLPHYHNAGKENVQEKVLGRRTQGFTVSTSYKAVDRLVAGIKARGHCRRRANTILKPVERSTINDYGFTIQPGLDFYCKLIALLKPVEGRT